MPLKVSTHSRPKAAGEYTAEAVHCCCVSTHSRPKAAGHSFRSSCPSCSSFNTQPPEGGWLKACPNRQIPTEFQHTAARRRLARNRADGGNAVSRFQHTAARRRLGSRPVSGLSNPLFQHTAARRRLAKRFQS